MPSTGMTTAPVDAIEDSTRAMLRCLDVLNALGADIQGLLEVGGGGEWRAG